MKKIGYLIFAFIYYICCIFPKRENKIFCIMTHDGSEDSSVGVVVEYLKKLPTSYEFQYMKKSDRDEIKKWKEILRVFFIKPYHLATSSYVFLDNCFLPMAYIRFSKKVKVVQLWHGTGTIKKFGQDVNTGVLAKLEKKSNACYTHLIVNSNHTKRLYQSAFGVEADKVFVWGLPRTDSLFDMEKRTEKIEHFYFEYPKLREKKIILYTPTFRDEEVEHPKIELDMEKLLKEIPKEYVLALKLHPHVAKSFQIDTHLEKWDKRLYQFSHYEDINTLLLVSDKLITDYSSIIFEYCLLEKPMIFFAYDLEKFTTKDRGFYETYETYVPGPVVKDTEELIEAILENKDETKRIQQFKEDSYAYLDGQSTKRLVDRIF